MKYLYILLLITFSITLHGQESRKIESITFIDIPPAGKETKHKIVIRADGRNDFSKKRINLDKANAHIEKHLKYGEYEKLKNDNVYESYPNASESSIGEILVVLRLTGDDSMVYIQNNYYRQEGGEYEGVSLSILKNFSESEQKLICKNLRPKCYVGELLGSSGGSGGRKLRIAYFDGKYGLVDEDDNFILPNVYENIELLDKGAFVFKNGNNIGVINPKGKIVMTDTLIPYSYVTYSKYLFGHIIADRGNEKGVWNEEGQLVIPDNYSTIMSSPLPDNPISNLDKVFFIATQFLDTFGSSFNSIYTLFDFDGHVVLDSMYDEMMVCQNPGIIVYGSSYDKDGDFEAVGVYDFDLNPILPEEFAYITTVAGYIITTKYTMNPKTGLCETEYAAFDENGKMVLPSTYSQEYELYEDLGLIE